ncbi:Type 1 glutamine amidotransferase-like domain-containing protein [Gordonia aurantiaca]|uniref:Type 1 glutamine amidotransferase-like domain-containing protein n=1 Tax=Gordonia sp. B21 TaxID=3151852 RepID=UPI003264E5A7
MPSTPDLLLLSRWLTPVPGFLVPLVGRGARIGYVPTASSIYPDQAWLELDRASLEAQGFDVVDVDPEQVSTATFTRALGEIDAIFVAGGNVFHLLGALRRTGADRPLVHAVEHGLPYIGASAGACITGPDIAPLALLDDPAEAEPLDSTEGLGFIGVTIVPHAEGTVGGRERIDRTREQFADHPLHFLRDDEAIVVSGGITRVIPG